MKYQILFLVVALILLLTLFNVNGSSILNKNQRKHVEIKTSSDPPLLTGALLMNRGLDFRQGGLVPEEKMRSAIFDYHFQKGKKYSPTGRKDLTFLVPDEITLTPTHVHIEQQNSSLFFSYQQTVRVAVSGFNFGIGIDTGKFGLGFQYGQQWGHIHDSLKTKYNASATGLYYSSLYSCIAVPYLFMKTDEMFSMILDKIPSRPGQKDLEMVKIFIDYYGGWFAWQGIFGGKIDMYSFLTRELTEKTDIKWMQQQMSLSFKFNLFDLSAGGFRNRTDIKIDKFFLENSAAKIYFTGGVRKYQTNSTLKQWDKSIDDYSGLLEGRFRPLSDLIKDEPVKKQNLEWIIRSYSETGKVSLPPASLKLGSSQLPKVPGYSIVGGGFDPIYMQTRRSIFVHDDHGFESFTTWKNPFYGQHEFAVPSSVWLRQNTGSTEINDTSVSFSKTEYEQKYAWSKTSSYFLGMGRRSTSVFHYNYYYDVHQRFALTQERVLTWYDLTLNPLLYFNEQMMNKYMDPILKDIIDNYLKADKYDTDESVRKLYRLVIETWGTDLVLSTTLGGGVTQSVYFKQDILKQVSINEVKTQSSFSFLGFLKFNNYNIKHDKRLSTWFKENVDVKIEYRGGRFKPRYAGTINGYKHQPTVETGSGSGANATEPWEEFVKTLRESPDVIKYNTVPLTYIIKDAKKKANMEKAIKSYVAEMAQTNLAQFYHAMN